MTEIINLSGEIEKQLPAELVDFIRQAGEVAAGQGQNLYLVGGFVRDLLLGRASIDLDLVVEGDAINLAQQLLNIVHGKIVTHQRFNTAKLQRDKWNIDLITARSETYSRPGALPRIKAGSLASDLFRRDFTINAMAVEVVPDRYGQLIDLYGGRQDLEHKIIRILHENSFVDDATRIWRALRYEQRLDFRLEADTLRLLQRDIPMLDTISGDRIRHEIELILQEALPEKILHRADKLKVLPKLHPTLKGDDWLTDKFKQARSVNRLLPNLYMALLFYQLSSHENEQLIAQLRLRRSLAQILRDTISLKTGLGALSDPGLAPSRIYSLLKNYSPVAISANAIAADSPMVKQHLQDFLARLRYIRPVLTGNDLKNLGIAPGPVMQEILQCLHAARLDGQIASRQDEEELVRRRWRHV